MKLPFGGAQGAVFDFFSAHCGSAGSPTKRNAMEPKWKRKSWMPHFGYRSMTGMKKESRSARNPTNWHKSNRIVFWSICSYLKYFCPQDTLKIGMPHFGYAQWPAWLYVGMWRAASAQLNFNICRNICINDKRNNWLSINYKSTANTVRRMGKHWERFFPALQAKKNKRTAPN